MSLQRCYMPLQLFLSKRGFNAEWLLKKMQRGAQTGPTPGALMAPRRFLLRNTKPNQRTNATPTTQQLPPQTCCAIPPPKLHLQSDELSCVVNPTRTMCFPTLASNYALLLATPGPIAKPIASPMHIAYPRLLVNHLVGQICRSIILLRCINAGCRGTTVKRFPKPRKDSQGRLRVPRPSCTNRTATQWSHHCVFGWHFDCQTCAQLLLQCDALKVLGFIVPNLHQLF